MLAQIHQLAAKILCFSFSKKIKCLGHFDEKFRPILRHLIKCPKINFYLIFSIVPTLWHEISKKKVFFHRNEHSTLCAYSMVKIFYRRFQLGTLLYPNIILRYCRFKNLPWGGKKTTKSFLSYLSEFLSHSVDFFSRIYSKVWSFFEAHFWGVQALATLIFHAFFAFRPLKKRPKKA